MRAERITYLVAHYNHGAYIGECIESLKAQTDPHWLAIICDDGSTDGSLERIRMQMDDRIALLVNGENTGYIATLERLIAESTTDIVAILDADDAIEPETTAELLDAFERNPGAALVYSRFATYDASLEVRIDVHGRAIRNGGTAIRDGTVGAIRSFRRSAYARTEGLNRRMQYAEDRDLVYKLEEIAPPVFVDRVLYRYRILSGSQSHDPVKREIGARNTHFARRAALKRRKLRGIDRAAAECMIACDYMEYSHRFPGPVRVLASRIVAVAASIWRRRDAALARDGA